MERITTHPVIDTSAPKELIDFTFNGKPYKGILGTAVSANLIALGYDTFQLHHKDNSPQGVFCANGQCSRCTVLINGLAKKACVTPLTEGMDVHTLIGLPVVPEVTKAFSCEKQKDLSCDVLIIGAGPSGLACARSLGALGVSVILADDKASAGGKLVLQTHKFFGSEADCYAGMRGTEIASLLETQVRNIPNVKLMLNSPVVAIYADSKAGIYENNSEYVLITFSVLVNAAGAREKYLLFPNNTLPGIYGAGAFQTLVNRDLVKPAKRIFIIGSGNVGLIAAYHALQAGIEVVGLIDIASKIAGYRVHAEKIQRLGIPIYLSSTVVRAFGNGKVEGLVVSKVDAAFNVISGSEQTFLADTVLIASGLASCTEFEREARSFNLNVVSCGDAEEIAEASSAMFGGKIAAEKAARLLGLSIEENKELVSTREVLKSRPGAVHERPPLVLTEDFQPNFFCVEEIPCNPCTSVCPTSSIKLKARKHSIMDLPYFEGGNCKGCSACVAACPGLALTLVRSLSPSEALVVLPWELELSFSKGDAVNLVSQDGTFIEEGVIEKIVYNKKYRTNLISVRASLANAAKIAGLRAKPKAVENEKENAEKQKLSASNLKIQEQEDLNLNSIVCLCERITVKEIIDYIHAYDIRDVNQLKSLRVGMGACGSKTCSQLLARVFAMAGVDYALVEKARLRPLDTEVTLGTLAHFLPDTMSFGAEESNPNSEGEA